ncbi:MAG: polysaccharide biosynthesis/export family protein [Chlamydiales bacterium]|nr:polysaccharide biosynthesis/export family protein [Chlamydiales bacterium]
MKMIRILVVLMIALSGCSNTPFKGSEVVGADEFVIDSYKIKEGKLSILEMEGRPLEVLDPELLKEYTNTVDDGDVLKIALFHASRGDLSGAVQSIGNTIGYAVTDGTITLPDIQPIEVKGLKLSEVRERIQEAYDREIDGIEVFIAYEKRDEKKIELAGLVSQSSIPVNGKKRLFEVLAEAKVPTNANLFKSYLVRDGKPLPVDMYRLIKEGDMSQNVVMHGGDKIYIAESSATSIMVMGEVRKEGVFDLPSGSMPLREALALAGGIPYTGDKGVIQVIRGNILRPKIYTLNWKHVMRLPTSSMLLMPGDIVYVAATPITEWNRFIQQIFPTLTGIELFRKGVSGVIAIQ